MNQFYTQIFRVVEQIPYGKVVSYGQIARILGKPQAAREVGRAMRYCLDELPWHRVVMKDGTIASRMSAVLQRATLEAEGVVFLADGRINMDECCWLDQLQKPLPACYLNSN